MKRICTTAGLPKQRRIQAPRHEEDRCVGADLPSTQCADDQMTRGIGEMLCIDREMRRGPRGTQFSAPTGEMDQSGAGSNSHEGLIGALIDTACGFAAATVVGRVLASHYSVNFLRPAIGERFVARARVLKPGKSQIFTACELYAVAGGAEKLVATGETLLVVVSGGAEA